MDAFANSPRSLELDVRYRAPELAAWCGTLTVAGMIRSQVQLDWVAPTWALLVVALAAIAWRSGQRVFVQQSVVLSFVVLFRAGTHNFYERSYFLSPAGYSRALTVGTTVALSFAGLAFAFRVREAPAGEVTGGRLRRAVRFVARRPEQVFFFCALVLLTALLGSEFDGGMITVAWGLEAVAIFVFALWVGERSYRLSGLGLLMLCLGKIAVVDFWQLGMRDRAITFLVLGGAITLVSILYTRKRELFQRFL